jgi:tartrate-resistant acid phosphatase type 5
MSHSRQGIGARILLALLILGFVTPLLFVSPASGQSYLYRFAVIGDYGNNSSHEAAVANLVKSWNPSFIITTGDNNYVNGEASTIDNNIGQHYGDFIGNYQGRYGDGSSTIRFFPSLGNHDWLTTGAQPYLNYFTLPGNERYYDFIRGNVHFFALDSDNNEPDGASSTSVQANWLRTRLAASTAQFQVVYFHHPPYSSSATHSPTLRMRWPFQEWGVDVVLSGHAHEYERLNINGLTYFVNGLGGASRYGAGTPVPGSLVRYAEAVGAQLVTVYDCGMSFEFYSVMGGSTLIDSYTLGTCGGTNPVPTSTTIPATAIATTVSNQQAIPASADAYVALENPGVNAGNSSSLRIDNSPLLRSYIRFAVPSGTGTITRAVLRFYAKNRADTPFSLASTSGSWSESTITYSNAPAAGSVIANSLGFAADTWIELDVSSLVKTAGQYNFVLLSNSSTASSFGSRESTTPPQLILSFAGTGSSATPLPIASQTPRPTATTVVNTTPVVTTAPLSFQPSAPYHATFFYPWYKNPNTDGSWSYWSDSGNNVPFTWFSHYIPNPYPQVFDPATELYSANNYEVFKWQLTKLAEARQEVAISSWWGPGTKEDVALANILNNYMARPDNPYPNLRWAIYYEDEGFGDPSVSTIVSDLQHIRANFAQSPYFLRVNGKPVVFVYDQGDGSTLTQRWAEANQQMGNEFYIVLKLYSGFASAPNQPDSWHQYAPANRYGIHAPYSAYVSPGFWLDDGSAPRLPRNIAEFTTAVQSLSTANVTWRLVETWNEWGEGTSVEPGQEVMLDATGREVINPNAVAFDNTYVQILNQYLPSLEQGTGSIAGAPQLPTATAAATGTPIVVATAMAAQTLIPTATTASNTGTLSLNPVADSYIYSDNPSSNFGTNLSLRMDASPIMRNYIRFDVPNLNGTIISATLRVYATSSNSVGYSVQSSSGAWDELSLTFNNAPAASGSYGSSGAIAANTWTQVNISSLVTGAGQYNLVLSSTSSTATAFASREATNKPQLVIVYGASTSGISSVGSSLSVPLETSITLPTSTAITLPTALPTNTATTLPTNAPTALPTNTATELPTALPSNTATTLPAVIPTALPTEAALPVLPTATASSVP